MTALDLDEVEVRSAVAAPRDPWDRKVYQWLETNLGAVLSFERQPRWRPGWSATVSIDGSSQAVYVRGPRGDTYVSPIDMHQEARIHGVFRDHGIPAPRVYGMIDDPICIVMEMLPGRIDTDTIDDPEMRCGVRAGYIDLVARAHALPIGAFDSVGLTIPVGPEAIALNLYAPSHAIFEQRIAGRPWPLMEFAWSWLSRNVPRNRNRLAFVNYDAGQFLFDDTGTITGLIDFEVSTYGDPAAELSGLRLRDSTEKLGDLATLIRRYEALTGDRISRSLIEYHTAGFCAVNGFLMWPLMFDSAPEQDFVAYLHYCVATSRWMIRAMADHDDVALEDPARPECKPLGFSQAARHLVRHVEAMPGDDAALKYQRDSAAAQALHLGRVNDYGQSVQAANLADIVLLTGVATGDWDAAQAALSAWIARNAGSEGADATLIKLFHRWLLRQSFLIEGCGQASYLTSVSLQEIKI